MKIFLILAIAACVALSIYAGIRLAKPKKNSDERQALLAMPLLRDMEFNPEMVLRRLRDHWKIPIRDEDIDMAAPSDQTCVFNVEGCRIGMSLMPVRIPAGEFDSLFPVSLYWDNAEEETATHQSHVVVFLSSETASAIERYSLFTKVVESILMETNSLGVYQGNQTLLVSRKNYIDFAQSLHTGDIPLTLWVFFGMQATQKGNTLYTFGLSGFNKLEMEIVDSPKDMGDLYEFLMNIASYVISGDVSFKEGETVGYTENVDAQIHISKGVCLDGNTIKLTME